MIPGVAVAAVVAVVWLVERGTGIDLAGVLRRDSDAAALLLHIGGTSFSQSQ